MTKILIMILAFIILAFVVVMYSAMVVAGRCDAKKSKSDDTEGNNDMLLEKRICSGCKTGKITYDLDPLSETCPYIECLDKGKCEFYVPLEKPSKTEKSQKTKAKNTPIH